MLSYGKCVYEVQSAISNMAAQGESSVAGNFLSFNGAQNGLNQGSKKRKRVNKNKKKSWNKHSDINDVEEFLDDVRLQQRTLGGILSEKSDDSLFFLDTGDEKKDLRLNKRKNKPLKIDLILQPDSQIPAPKDILSYQQPNAKKLRRIAIRAKKLEAQGVLPRSQRLLLARLKNPPTRNAGQQLPGNDPGRCFFDLWGDTEGEAPKEDPFYLEQTKRKQVARPRRLNIKPSALPPVEIPVAGASYNPDFESHQSLLLQAHEVEVKRQKEEDRLQRQLAVPPEAVATEETKFTEQLEGLLEEDEESETEKDDAPGKGAEAEAEAKEKKTEKERKRERLLREMKMHSIAQRKAKDHKQELFRLRSIKAELRKSEEVTAQRQQKRRDKKDAEVTKTKRLGRLKYQDLDLDVQLSDEISGSLRKLKPEGSILKERFKSLQKRNLIEPRERAKFKRKYKLKYVEKRAFKEVQL
ncbi:ribosome biogenesis protein NOP53 [Polypterus senegalus]|uniref:ribosome biogenesis protein NOP53 n=1 Tax=Polypterus senegalus TaxID=55291 RepID=UPI001964C32C|nr:ribosome biogenesis protein NOP53 [Polypterus senegalus]